VKPNADNATTQSEIVITSHNIEMSINAPLQGGRTESRLRKGSPRKDRMKSTSNRKNTLAANQSTLIQNSFHVLDKENICWEGEPVGVLGKKKGDASKSMGMILLAYST